MSLEDLEKRIEKIEERNKKVETDKAWETSWARRLLILVLTYLVMSTFMNSIGVSNPLINAIIPTLGFMLSTLSLSFFKGVWEKHQKTK